MMVWTLSLYPPSPSPAAAPLVTHARFSGLLSYATSTGTVTVTVRVAAVAAAMVDTTPHHHHQKQPSSQIFLLPSLPTGTTSSTKIFFFLQTGLNLSNLCLHTYIFFFKCQECWRKKYMYVLKHKVQFQR